MSDLLLATYNVLADPLANEEHYPRNDPIDLDPTVRQGRLLRELDRLVRRRYILTLQEVSKDQMQWLVPMFHSQGYQSHWFSKGFQRDGYQGVMVAYPRAFRLIELDFLWVNNEVKSDSLERRPPRSPVLILYLQKGSHCFWLATVHMPADPRLAEIRTKYMDYVMARLQDNGRRTGCKHLIIAGDFNQDPNLLMDKPWHDVSGNEKPTIVSWSVRDTRPVRLRVDTVMASPSVEFVSSDVPTISDEAFLPNSKHSSDHVPVAVKLKLRG